LVLLFCLLTKSYNLGRGRARSTQIKEPDSPGGLQDYAEIETASFTSQQSEINDMPQRSNEETPSDEV